MVRELVFLTSPRHKMRVSSNLARKLEIWVMSTTTVKKSYFLEPNGQGLRVNISKIGSSSTMVCQQAATLLLSLFTAIGRMLVSSIQGRLQPLF